MKTLNKLELLLIALIMVVVITMITTCKVNAATKATKVVRSTPTISKEIILNDHNEKVITNRKGRYTVLEVVRWKCLGHGNGLSTKGYYISYRNNRFIKYKKGHVYMSVLKYNDKTNYTDDVASRDDYLIK